MSVVGAAFSVQAYTGAQRASLLDVKAATLSGKRSPKSDAVVPRENQIASRSSCDYGDKLAVDTQGADGLRPGIPCPGDSECDLARVDYDFGAFFCHQKRGDWCAGWHQHVIAGASRSFKHDYQPSDRPIRPMQSGAHLRQHGLSVRAHHGQFLGGAQFTLRKGHTGFNRRP